MQRSRLLLISLAALAFCGTLWLSAEPVAQRDQQAHAASPASDAKQSHRSPVDLVLAPSGEWLVTANETSHSLSLVDTASGKVLDEVPCGRHPVAVALSPDGTTVLVSSRDEGLVSLFAVEQQKLKKLASIVVGMQPHDIAVSPDGKRAFVGLVAAAQVAEIDLTSHKVGRKIDVSPWPRYLTLSPDGTRLAVACSGASEIDVVDTTTGKLLYDEPLSGAINIGHMTTSADGKYAYFPWMIYRSNPIDERNIRLGWVLASRIGRVKLDGPAYREAISLDVPGIAVADPHGLAINNNQTRLVVAASGTHELLVYRLQDLPFIAAGGPGDLIDQKLLNDRDLFYRIPLGGRPMSVCFSPDNRTAYVANYLQDAIQVVDVEAREVLSSIALGGPEKPSLARQGAEVFYDGKHSLDQWYSCHTCHYNGGVNSKAMDTWNDGTPLTSKTVLPLYHLHQTKPWTWHGWQESLAGAMDHSFRTTMVGKGISYDQREAILAYFAELQPAPNPHRLADGSLSEAAQRGKEIFASAQANCAQCHKGEFFTDGEIHDVGLGAEKDQYQGYNTPTLLGVYAKVRFLHDGRARTLEAVLSGDHAPSKVSGTKDLSEAQLADLVAYLKSL